MCWGGGINSTREQRDTVLPKQLSSVAVDKPPEIPTGALTQRLHPGTGFT